VVLFLFILAFSTTAKFYDYDLWARLIVGMGVVQTGHVFKHDFLSYAPTHIWYDHEWGSSVIFYLTQHFFGSAGILILQAVLIFLIFFMISKVVELRGVKTTTAYNFLFYYWAFIAIGDSLVHPIRCQLFSFIFFAVFIFILEKVRLGKGSDKNLIWLPVIMLVWNNLHGGCVAGIGLIVLYIIGEILNRKPVMKYVYTLLGTLAVLPINPWGFDYLKFLFMANTMSRAYIIEWDGLFSAHHAFTCMKFKWYTLILLLTESGVVIKQCIDKTFNFDKTKFIVVVATLFLAIEHMKLLPLALISMVCFFYDDFYTAFNAITKNFFNKIAVTKDTIVYILILIFAASMLNTKAFQPLVGDSGYPVMATEFMRTNKIKGNILVSFGLGSYVSYKLYPNNKVLIDGRYEEVYYDDILPLLQKFYLIKPGWEEVLKKYPPDIMILEKDYPVSYALLDKKGYRLLYEDKFARVWIKSSFPKRKFKPPNTDANYYKRTVFDTDANFVLKSKNGKQ
jgi:hypothetical protein